MERRADAIGWIREPGLAPTCKDCLSDYAFPLSVEPPNKMFPLDARERCRFTGHQTLDPLTLTHIKYQSRCRHHAAFLGPNEYHRELNHPLHSALPSSLLTAEPQQAQWHHQSRLPPPRSSQHRFCYSMKPSCSHWSSWQCQSKK